MLMGDSKELYHMDSKGRQGPIYDQAMIRAAAFHLMHDVGLSIGCSKIIKCLWYRNFEWTKRMTMCDYAGHRYIY